jgi:radical SAM family RiPP maturation amino acid epimerase
MPAFPSFLSRFSESEQSQIAHAKRFGERYTADPDFRELVAIDPRKAAQQYNLNIDPEELRPLWDPEENKRVTEQNLPLSPLLKLVIERDNLMAAWIQRHRNGESLVNPKYRAWWKRQVARNDSEVGTRLNFTTLHAPMCFELSAGCTVGCWFCAISAEKFAGAFAYTPENKELWREVLEVVRDIIGPAVEAGFCYWATDPLDNPDYEKFIKDYQAIIGALPSTNTAKAHKDLSRIRSILEMWRAYDGFPANQLSILTVNILDRVHEEFTPEELLWTGLNLLNKQSLVTKASAGRARDKIKKLAEGTEEHNEIKAELAPSTIACISGFLFNMVEKTVKLITPCKASDRWPKGYKILEEGTFNNGADLKILMEGIIENNMPLTISNNEIVKFREDLEYKPLPQGFALLTEYQTRRFNSPVFGKKIGELIRQGSHTVDEILEAISQPGVDRKEARKAIEALFDGGLLEEHYPMTSKIEITGQ